MKKTLLALGVVVLFLVILVVGWWITRPGFDEEAVRRAIAELDTEIDAWQARTWPRPPLPGEPVEGRAWVHYREAIRLLGKLDREFGEERAAAARDELKAPLRGPWTPSPLVREYLAHLGPVFDELDRGARTSETASWVPIREYLVLLHDDLPLLHALGAIADLLCARAILRTESGDTLAGVRDLQVLDRMGSDQQCGGLLLHHAVGTSRRFKSLQVLADLTGAKRYSEVERRAIAEWVTASLDDQLPGWDVITGETLYVELSFRYIWTGLLDPPIHDLLGRRGRALRRAYARLLCEHRQVLAEARRISAGERLPAVAHTWRRALESAAESKSALEDPLLWSAWHAAMIFEVAVLDPLAKFSRKLRMHREAVLLGLALLDFHDREGRYPASLEEFRPETVRENPGADEWVYDPGREGGPAIWLRSMLDEDPAAEPLFRVW